MINLGNDLNLSSQCLYQQKHKTAEKANKSTVHYQLSTKEQADNVSSQLVNTVEHLAVKEMHISLGSIGPILIKWPDTQL